MNLVMLFLLVTIESVPNISLLVGLLVVGTLSISLLLVRTLRLTGTRDRLIGCIEKESILGKDISTCLPVSLNIFPTV